MLHAVAETAGTRGDADDPAIWVNPRFPDASLILGADKTRGLMVHDLAGNLLHEFPDGLLNNVDLRPQFPLAGGQVTLVGATKRDDDTIVFYTISDDGVMQRATPFAFPAAPAHMAGEVDDVYGFTMLHDRASDRFYAIANYKSGHVFQWQIVPSGNGFHLNLARSWRMASQPEGMAADDANAMIYVGEEDAGIWRIPAAPEANPMPVAVDLIGSDCLPKDDVEGLSVWEGPNGSGWLVASAQGVHRYALYPLLPDARGEQPCAGSFGIAAGPIDGVTETDGLAVTSTRLGEAYPEGLLVVMDDQNEGFTTNFKLVSFAEVTAALGR